MKSILIALLGVFIFQNNIAQTRVSLATDSAITDINMLVSTFEKVHYNPYFKTSKAEFNAIKTALLSDWKTDSISLKRFMITGMKLTAMMSGGHSVMDWQNEQLIPEIKSHLYIPFSGKLNDKNQFIVTKSSISEIQVGDQIETLNGYKIVDLYAECMTYTGGIEAFKNATCEKLFPIYLFFNDALQPPYTIQKSNQPEPVNHQGLDLTHLITLINTSQNQEEYTFQILENQIALISYNACNDYEKFDQFLAQTFKTIAENNIDQLIIDIRENGGGNSELNDLLLAYITPTPYRQSSGRYWKVSDLSKQVYSNDPIYTEVFGADFIEKYLNTPSHTVITDTANYGLITPEKVPYYFTGKSCLLIGPNTFSSANFLADAVKTYKLTTLIGLPTGEYTNDFGEQLHFQLKNSSCYVFISSTYDIGANGNQSILQPVYPDITVHADALEYAIEWIQK